MNLPKYEDLTPQQKSFICNGCGKKGGKLKAPDWFMLADCNHHDYGYYRGHTEEDRKKCDETFLKEMKKDVSRSPFYLKPARWSAAYAYYWAVRWFGKSAFYFAEKPRTLGDLEKEMFFNQKRFVG